MSEPACPICDAEMLPDLIVSLLGSRDRQLLTCANCQASTYAAPDWLEEAYSEPIAMLDTGAVVRAVRASRDVSGLLASQGLSDARVVDWGAGHGLLTRLLRSRGINAVWHDPLSPNIHAKGFEFGPGSQDPASTVVVMVEVLEHLEDPVQELSRAVADTGAGMLAVTTVLAPPAITPDWWYLLPETGQHILFLRERSMRVLAERLGMSYWGLGSWHIFSKGKYSPTRARLALTGARLASRLFLGPARGDWTDHEVLLSTLRGPKTDR